MTEYLRKSYSELIMLDSFEDRFNYLKLEGTIGEETFGSLRYLNQRFYTGKEWLDFKRQMILRDNGCDLGIPGFELNYGLTLHHINPVSADDILNRNIGILLNPENVICVSLDTHRAIHYGSDLYVKSKIIERSKNDTCPWKNIKE